MVVGSEQPFKHTWSITPQSVTSPEAKYVCDGVSSIRFVQKHPRHRSVLKNDMLPSRQLSAYTLAEHEMITRADGAYLSKEMPRARQVSLEI